MQPMPHQLMGYDRAITMFSPDGRLLQVEYAKKTVKQGSAAIAMICKDGLLFVTDKRILDPLIVTSEVEKIWQIDDHIGVSASGILSDARVLIERSQVTSQQHKVTYDAPIDVLTIVKDICDLKQLTTQSGGLRPFGVSLLVGGIDEEGSKLYLTDPTGIYFPYQAIAIGEGDGEITETVVLSIEITENPVPETTLWSFDCVNNNATANPTIMFNIGNEADANITIYNVKGEVVKTADLSGNYEVTDLSSGVYLFKLSSEMMTGKNLGKFVIVK